MGVGVVCDREGMGQLPGRGRPGSDVVDDQGGESLPTVRPKPRPIRANTSTARSRPGWASGPPQV